MANPDDPSPAFVVSSATHKQLKTMMSTLRVLAAAGPEGQQRLTQLLIRYEKQVNSFTVLEVSEQFGMSHAND